MTIPIHPGLSEEASYRYDERLAILGCYGKPTPEQHEMAWKEATDFDRRTIRLRMGLSNEAALTLLP